jgi:hypothetical protein
MPTTEPAAFVMTRRETAARTVYPADESSVTEQAQRGLLRGEYEVRTRGSQTCSAVGAVLQ